MLARCAIEIFSWIRLTIGSTIAVRVTSVRVAIVATIARAVTVSVNKEKKKKRGTTKKTKEREEKRMGKEQSKSERIWSARQVSKSNKQDSVEQYHRRPASPSIPSQLALSSAFVLRLTRHRSHHHRRHHCCHRCSRRKTF